MTQPSTKPRTPTTSTDAILNRDDTINQLDDDEIRDTFARIKLTEYVMRNNGPAYQQSQEWSSIEETLQNGNGITLKEAVTRLFGRDADISQALGWETGPGNARTLYNLLTEDDATIDDARQAVKRTAKQSGIPSSKMCVARIEYHADN